MVLRMSRQQKSCAFSVCAEQLLERQRVRDRRLAGEIAAHIGCGLPIQQSPILQERDSGNAWVSAESGSPMMAISLGFERA